MGTLFPQEGLLSGPQGPPGGWLKGVSRWFSMAFVLILMFVASGAPSFTDLGDPLVDSTISNPLMWQKYCGSRVEGLSCAMGALCPSVGDSLANGCGLETVRGGFTMSSPLSSVGRAWVDARKKTSQLLLSDVVMKVKLVPPGDVGIVREGLGCAKGAMIGGQRVLPISSVT